MFCSTCQENFSEQEPPCSHLLEEVEKKKLKKCSNCHLEKNIEDSFYYITTKKGEQKYRNKCKDCYKIDRKIKEKNNNKKDTFHCDDCNIIILLRNKASHLRSIAHRNKSGNEYERGFKDGSKKAYNELKPLIKKLVNKWRSLKLD